MTFEPWHHGRLVRPVRFSWYTNVCTPSYSFAWWGWARWEKEIDLMAMQGVNIMYAHTGTEYLQVSSNHSSSFTCLRSHSNRGAH